MRGRLGRCKGCGDLADRFHHVFYGGVLLRRCHNCRTRIRTRRWNDAGHYGTGRAA